MVENAISLLHYISALNNICFTFYFNFLLKISLLVDVIEIQESISCDMYPSLEEILDGRKGGANETRPATRGTTLDTK